jgi:hypothetical protein
MLTIFECLVVFKCLVYWGTHLAAIDSISRVRYNILILSNSWRPLIKSNIFVVKVSDNKKRWSVVSIFNRIGISKKFLGDNYDKIVEDINHKAEGMSLNSATKCKQILKFQQ